MDDETDDLAEGNARAERLADGIKPALEGFAADKAAMIEGKAEHQLSLLPTGPVDLDDEPEALETRRGAGRPAGSRNRATVEAAEWILSRYRSPLAFLAETFTRPVELLAKELGCDREKAFGLQLRAAEGLAPYVHRKQPQAVELEGGELPVVLLVKPELAAGLKSGEIDADDLPMEIVEDQGLSADESEKSDSAKSDSEAK